jgi:hypothetical protein
MRMKRLASRAEHPRVGPAGGPDPAPARGTDTGLPLAIQVSPRENMA